MYNIGDNIVHPMHGAGTITEIKNEVINGVVCEYYIIKLISNKMTVMVPIAACEKIGIRNVISKEKADELISSATSIRSEEILNWNQRYRDNSARIKSGDLLEVMKVIKSLLYRDSKNGLSNGERKMLHSAKQILLSELVIAKNSTPDEIESIIDRVLCPKQNNL